jgi:hypothetical protein
MNSIPLIQQNLQMSSVINLTYNVITYTWHETTGKLNGSLLLFFILCLGNTAGLHIMEIRIKNSTLIHIFRF